jgi:hypothetical protein
MPVMSITDSLRLSAPALTKMRVKNAPKRCVGNAVFGSEIAPKSAREKCVDFAWIFCLGDSSGIHTKKIDKNKAKIPRIFHAFSTPFFTHPFLGGADRRAERVGCSGSGAQMCCHGKGLALWGC